MKCPSCGAENMDGSSTCWECGAPFAETRERARGGWAVWALVAAGGVALVAMLLTAGPGGGAGTGGSVESTASVSATSSLESSSPTLTP